MTSSTPPFGRWLFAFAAAMFAATVLPLPQGAAAEATGESGVEAGSTVAVVRAPSIMTTEGLFSPTWLYPEGRIDYGVIEWLLNRAVAGAVGVDSSSEAWQQLIGPGDRIGIQIDVEGIQPHDPLLEALVRQIIDRGVPMRNIIIFAGEESALFRAGFDISGRTPGVRVMATDTHGYRNGLSRIVLNETTRIINVSRLRVDPKIGMYGALANCLAVLPYPDRERLMRNPEQLPAAAAKATMKRKVVLQILDTLSPGFHIREGTGRYETWTYNGVMASRDPVALDSIGRTILEEKRAGESDGVNPPRLDVDYLGPAADNFRLGTADPDQILLVEIGP